MDPSFTNLRHLRAALEVAKSNSISAASKSVHLSQPAISQALFKLEKSLGVAIFDRRSNGVFPTEAGLLFLKRAERALDLLQRGANIARRTEFGNNGGGKAQFHRFLTAAQLRALVAVSRCGNFSMAARSVGISQPSLHRAARDLEKLSGLTLFKSGKHGVEISPAAVVFSRFAMLASAELRHARNEINHQLGQETSAILIGTLPLARSHILPASISQLVSEQSGIQLRIIDGPYDAQIVKLCQGEIDFMIGALRPEPPADDLVQETLFIDTLAIAVRQGHPLTRQKTVTSEDLLEYPWVAPPIETPTGRFIYQKLEIARLARTPVRVVSSSLLLVRELALNGDYITIISTHQIAAELEQGMVVTIPHDMSNSERPIGLTYRQNWHPTSVQNRLLSIIRDIGGNSKIE